MSRPSKPQNTGANNLLFYNLDSVRAEVQLWWPFFSSSAVRLLMDLSNILGSISFLSYPKHSVKRFAFAQGIGCFVSSRRYRHLCSPNPYSHLPLCGLFAPKALVF